MKSSVRAELQVGSSLAREVLGLAVLALVLEATAVVGAMLNMELPSVPSRCSRDASRGLR